MVGEGCLSQNVDYHGWPTKKNYKTRHWLKCHWPNLDQKINDSKPNIWSLSINFRFSRRKSQSNFSAF